jgi:copper(I)-binding protein
MDGGEFTGLAGSPYTATNASFTASATDTTKYPNGIGKVRMDKAAVYKVPVSQASGVVTATTANIGLSYAILVNTNDQQVDLNTTTTPSVKVIDFSKDGKFVFVTLV